MALQQPFSNATLFERAVRRVLRPLVRALISQNVAATMFYRIVKQTYVEVAEETLGKDATDSRISVVTGVHRRDVKEFRMRPDDGSSAVGKRLSTLSTVVGRWLSDPDFTNENGVPLILPRSESAKPSFDGLVQSVSRDIRPRTLLDELQRQGVIELDGDKVRLVLDGLVAGQDLDRKLHFFSHNVGDHMQAAVENLLSDPSPHLERAVFYNNLTAASAHDLEERGRDLAQHALLQINTEASALQKRDQAEPEADYRIRFGVFFFTEKEEEGLGGNED
ncbi:MAG: DUF6502 family protein [Pseudomonadota bacterium]